jgi:hypothetical protein
LWHASYGSTCDYTVWRSGIAVDALEAAPSRYTDLQDQFIKLLQTVSPPYARAQAASTIRQQMIPEHRDAMKDDHTLLNFAIKAVIRAGMRALISPLVRWSPMERPEDGYTVLIGCTHRLQALIPANLRMLAQQDAPNCREVLLGIDCERDELDEEFEARIRAAAGRLRVRCLFYTPRQRRVSRAIDWGWVYAWLNWSLGIANATTRYAMLHDFDALLLNPRVLEQRYATIRERAVEYLGMDYYAGLGVRPDDGLVKTFELMFDCSFVRRRFRPIELFNAMRRFRGRLVEFDTFLNAQSKDGKTSVLPIDETEMVHPSQMICQFVDFSAGRRRVPPGNNNLLMIPFYEHLGGDGSLIALLTRELNEGDGHATLWNLDVRRLTPAHAAWVRKQGARAELGLGRPVSAESAAYFDAIDRWAKGRAG